MNFILSDADSVVLPVRSGSEFWSDPDPGQVQPDPQTWQNSGYRKQIHLVAPQFLHAYTILTNELTINQQYNNRNKTDICAVKKT